MFKTIDICNTILKVGDSLMKPVNSPPTPTIFIFFKYVNNPFDFNLSL